MLRKSVVCFSILILTALDSFAQKSIENPASACNPNFARLLVEQQVADGKTVEDTEKRIKILLRSADFLWKFDEQTARKYFLEAFLIATKRFGEKGFEKKEVGSLTSYQPDYRAEVIRAVSLKDGEWAKQMSEKMLKDYEAEVESRKEDYDKTRELGELLGIAKETAKDNPQLSLYFFRKVLKYPLESHWYWSLYATAAENQKLTDQIYSEALNAYADETPRRMLFLSAYPFSADRVFGIDKYQYGAAVPADFAANPNLQIQFLSAFFNRADRFLNNPEDLSKSAEQYRLPEIAYIVSALQDIEPIILQKFPNLFERFAAIKAKANAQLNVETRKNLEGRQKNYEKFSLSFNERLKKLEEADSEGKLNDNMIVDLVFSLKTEEAFAELETWLDKIKDESLREDTVDYFYFKRSQLATKESRFDAARKYADKVVEIDHKAILYFGIAEARLKNAYQRGEADEILSEVSKLAQKADDSAAKAQIQLGLAYIYEKYNHYNALDELGEAIKTINKLENPDIFSTSVFSQIKGKDFAFYAVFNTPGFNLETTFEAISKKDFELSLSNAQNLRDKYFRTLAVLAVAKNCVENQPKVKPENQKPSKKNKQ